MSHNSPAKNERIERHIMRQRGAGARAINADFEFSFAGFSAPNSQEATPTAASSEPSTKRRKTIVGDEGVEHEAAKTSALDRRGRTKAARARKRFVAHVDEQPVKSKSEESADGEDSFVRRTGAKRREGRTQQASKGVQEENPAQEPSETLPKAKSTRARNTLRRGKRAKEAQDADVVVANAAEQHTGGNEKTPKRSKRAAARKDIKAIVGDDGTAKEDEEVPDDGPAPTTKLKGRSRKAAGNGEVAKELAPVERNDHDGPTKSAPETAPKKSRGTRKATKNEDGDESKKVREETAGFNGSDETADAQPAPRRKTARAGPKSKAAKNRTLASTPPQLERRPLQEADANRSPSPRKSPEKEQRDLKPQASPKVTGSTRKRNDVVETGGPGQDCPRKSRKLKAQRDEGHAQGKGDFSAGASKGHPGKLEVEAVAPVAAVNDAEPERQSVEEQARSKRPKKNAKTSKASEPQAAQFLAPSMRGKDGEEEDVDWLFAAPDARPNAVPTKPSARRPPPPQQRTTLADIDLDDLIANVALFARTGGRQSDAIAAGGGIGSTARKGREA